MANFLIDEDLPRSLKSLLQAAGLDAEDVRDIGLRHTEDLSGNLLIVEPGRIRLRKR